MSSESKRIDQLVKDLAERYRSQKDRQPKVEDTWTSSPMVLSFIDIQEKGIMPERDGFSEVFTSELSSMLNGSGRVRVVERVLLDRLLSELNLGSSDLADPETKLKLGRVLAARLIGTGSLMHMPQGALLSLRLIDSETTEIPESDEANERSGRIGETNISTQPRYPQNGHPEIPFARLSGQGERG